jgi:hypothetical protein
MDVEQILDTGDERELHQVWDTQAQRRMWSGVRDKNRAKGDAQGQAVAEQALAELPEVTALQALRANARLVGLLTGRRWIAMQDAREAGASWEQIGEALGMSKQGAHDFYRRKIADQETYVGDLHDAERARAALADVDQRATGSVG